MKEHDRMTGRRLIEKFKLVDPVPILTHNQYVKYTEPMTVSIFNKLP
jgi:hypothetical protein